jgi:hypothetical protein
VNVVDEHVSGDDGATVGTRDDSGVIAGAEENGVRGPQPFADPGDEPELPRIRNRDVANSPRPIRSLNAYKSLGCKEQQ